MKTLSIILTLGFILLASACYTDSTKDSGAESSEQNEPASRSRSRSY